MKAALINQKVMRELNSGFNCSTPLEFVECIMRGEGVANTIIFFGPIKGCQEPIKKKLIPAITKLHEFRFLEQGAIARKVCQIGNGKSIDIAKTRVTTTYDYKIMNPDQLCDGRPIKETSNPIDKTGDAGGPGKKAREATDPNRDLTTYQYIRHRYIQSTGIEQLQQLQPDVPMGGKVLLQELQTPTFTDNLLRLQVPTKLSPHDSMQKNLSVGHGLPIWGSGKNVPSKKAKQFLEKLFQQGQTSKPMTPSEAENLLMEATGDDGEPLFCPDTFMDQEQIKAYFASLSRDNRKTKRTTPASKRRNVTSATGSRAIAGVDYEDIDNEAEQQELEEEMQDLDALGEAAAIDQDALQIENVLENLGNDSDQCPITINSIDLCAIAEQIMWDIGDPISKLTSEEKEVVIAKIEPDQSKRKMSSRQLRLAISNYIKKNCTCASII